MGLQQMDWQQLQLVLLKQLAMELEPLVPAFKVSPSASMLGFVKPSSAIVQTSIIASSSDMLTIAVVLQFNHLN